MDAEGSKRPLVSGHDWRVSGSRVGISWSRNATHFAFEEDLGGYLPILDVLRLSLNLGLKAGSP